MTLLLAGLLLVSLASAQWETCPLGLVNDTYPGSCGKYIDTNNDNICDRSQTMPTTTNPAASTTQPSATTHTTSTTIPQTQGTVNQQILWGEYNLIPLSAATIFLYLASLLLSRAKKISLLTHRRIWNVVLLLSFIVCGLTGILIVVRLDLRWDIPYMALISFWHTETGIIMTIVSVFHALWHWKYYLALVIKREEKRKE
jgi:hypothetical protein